MESFESLALKFHGKDLWVLDQRRLPDEEVWLKANSTLEMVEHIKSLAVRGAPLIAVAAAAQLGLMRQNGATQSEYLESLEALKASRPTAVNLSWAMEAMRECFEQAEEVATKIFKEDRDLCTKISKNGQDLIKDGDVVLTHCNTGGLATAGSGTALGIITEAHKAGKRIHVYVDETRPLLQGGRLTAWELEKHGVSYTIICDNMAAPLLRDGKVQKVVLGADRIALNGDFANKTGTYNLAVLCDYHNVPFYTAAPYTTVDFSLPTGADIPIEQRLEDEVRGAAGAFGTVRWSPEKATVYNPGFDVTPGTLLTGIVFDSGYLSQSEIKKGEIQELSQN